MRVPEGRDLGQTRIFRKAPAIDALGCLLTFFASRGYLPNKLGLRSWVVGVGGGDGRVASSHGRALEVEEIAKGNRVQDRFQFMIAVCPPAENVQQEIDFAGRKP